jgi:hypothetical protein
LKQLLQALVIPDLSMPGNHATLRINTTQQVRYQISVRFQIDQIVKPTGAPKAPVACADGRIVLPTCPAASQRVQCPATEVWPDADRLWQQVGTNLEPIRKLAIQAVPRYVGLKQGTDRGHYCRSRHHLFSGPALNSQLIEVF